MKVWRDLLAHLLLAAAIRVGTPDFAGDLLELVKDAEREASR